eukprot:360207-Chlamydomonas_euryale.AAC.2
MGCPTLLPLSATRRVPKLRLLAVVMHSQRTAVPVPSAASPLAAVLPTCRALSALDGKHGTCRAVAPPALAQRRNERARVRRTLLRPQRARARGAARLLPRPGSRGLGPGQPRHIRALPPQTRRSAHAALDPAHQRSFRSLSPPWVPRRRYLPPWYASWLTDIPD